MIKRKLGKYNSIIKEMYKNNLDEEKIIAYHGGQKGIKAFSLKYAPDNVLFFTTNKGLAKDYLGYNDEPKNQELYTVELNINNPLNLRDLNSLNHIAKALHPNNINLQKEWLQKEKEYIDKWIKTPEKIAWYIGNIVLKNRNDIIKYAKDNNYDAIYNYESDIHGNISIDYSGIIIFNPKNVKITDREYLYESKLNESLDNGIIAYHGTNKKFNDFDKKFIGKNTSIDNGFHFTNNIDVAKSYGNNILKVKLFMNSPIVIDFNGRSATYFLGKLLGPQGITNKVVEINNDLNSHYDIDEDIMEELSQYGFNQYADNYIDGIIFKNILDNFNFGGNISTNYVVFEPNQIKSIDNNGEWNSNSNNINESKQSNLNDNFWKWFGNSKIVDKDGNPLVCYHGTNQIFNIFDKNNIGKNDNGYYGKGFYFTPVKSAAKYYSGESGNIIQVYLSIKNPLDLTEFVEKRIEDISNEKLKELGIYDKKITPNSGIMRFENYINYFNLSDRLTKQAIKNGYDGIYIGADIIEIVAFYPNQIKSTFNKGNWSLNSNNINESVNDFFASTIIDTDYAWQYDFKNGEPITVEAYHSTPHRFDSFKVGKVNAWGKGVYLTTNYKQNSFNPETTKNWYQMRLYATFFKPFIYEYTISENTIKFFINEIKQTLSNEDSKKIEESFKPIKNIELSSFESYINTIFKNTARTLYKKQSSLEVVDTIKHLDEKYKLNIWQNLNIDGMVLPFAKAFGASYNKDMEKTVWYICYKPNQIKSYENNNGNYDLNSNNINESINMSEDLLYNNEDIDELFGKYDVNYVLQAFKEGKQNLFYPLINPAEYKRALLEFMKYGEFMTFPIKKLIQWWNIIVKNTALLNSITDIVGHSYNFPLKDIIRAFFNNSKEYKEYVKKLLESEEMYIGEYGEEYFINDDGSLNDEAVAHYILDEKGFYNWARLPNDDIAWSDYGIKPLIDILLEYNDPIKPSELIVLINRALDVTHQNGDLPSAFIQGGSSSLTKISNENVNNKNKGL